MMQGRQLTSKDRAMTFIKGQMLELANLSVSTINSEYQCKQNIIGEPVCSFALQALNNFSSVKRSAVLAHG